MVIELPRELEAKLQAELKRRKIKSPVEWVRQTLKCAEPEEEELESIAHLQGTEEWWREFHAWADSHPRGTPLLSDEAIDRESIYEGRP